MKSMTGYGEGAAQGRWVKVLVQVRTLNHRHLDVQLRVPREYLSFEEDLRKVIRQNFSLRPSVDIDDHAFFNPGGNRFGQNADIQIRDDWIIILDAGLLLF